MARQHGRLTVIKVLAYSAPASGMTDLSQFITSSALTRGADIHDVTGYGQTSHVSAGGLKTATFTMQGVYDSASSATPRVVLEQHLGDLMGIIRQPEGTGSSKPQQRFDCQLNSYVETNPVADMVTWQADFTVSGDVDNTGQS